MRKAVHLRSFSAEEILLSEEEVRTVFRFFWPSKSGEIDAAVIDFSMSVFAQGLLVEALDATHSMGYLHQLVNALHAAILPAKNGSSAVKLIQSFSKKASAHWFKHTTVNDLSRAKIYETVRVSLARSFGRILDAKLLGLAVTNPPTAMIEYAAAACGPNRVWA